MGSCAPSVHTYQCDTQAYLEVALIYLDQVGKGMKDGVLLYACLRQAGNLPLLLDVIRSWLLERAQTNVIRVEVFVLKN